MNDRETIQAARTLAKVIMIRQILGESASLDQIFRVIRREGPAMATGSRRQHPQAG